MVTLQDWLDEASLLEPTNPNAAALATVTADGLPQVRMVLVKSLGAGSIVFYTNLESQKSKSLAFQPAAALCLYWKSIGRQVRIEGVVRKVEESEADAYFASRTRESQISAWSSLQSAALASRSELEKAVLLTEDKFYGKQVFRPPFWSGFKLIPNRLEFWIERKARLHDRVEFNQDGGRWHWRLLYP